MLFIILLLICPLLSHTTQGSQPPVQTIRKQFFNLEGIIKFNLMFSTPETNQTKSTAISEYFKNFDAEMQQILYLSKNYNYPESINPTNNNELIEIQYKNFQEFLKNDTWTHITSTLKQIIKNHKDFASGPYDTLKQQNLQQVELYNIYNKIESINLKIYILTKYALIQGKLLLENNNSRRRLRERFGNFPKNNQRVENEYRKNNEKLLETFRDLINIAPLSISTSNPTNHIEGTTYLKLSPFVQGFVMSEVDLQKDGKCTESCRDFVRVQQPRCATAYCKEHRCMGTIVDCIYYDSNLQICYSNSQNRQYEYIKFDNGRSLGNKSLCHQKMRWYETTKQYWFIKCDYCFCFCEHRKPTGDYFFNMRPVTSNISENKVVTGARFVKRNRMIHLQIQEGKLLPYGNIDEASVAWVPVEDYRFTDDGIDVQTDFYVFKWDQRQINLDNLMVDTNHLLTGVRFENVGGSLNLVIMMTPFYFFGGNLLPSRHPFATKSVSKFDARKQQKLINPDLPTNTHEPLNEHSSDHQYVVVTYSSIESDVAQTIVPFFDAQPVESKIAAPLIGFGISHRGRKNSGGFIAPKIFPYDYRPLFNNNNNK